MSVPKRSKSLAQTFARPALLAVITLAALVLGLVSDDRMLDTIAVIGLALPLAVGLRHVWTPRGKIGPESVDFGNFGK